MAALVLPLGSVAGADVSPSIAPIGRLPEPSAEQRLSGTGKVILIDDQLGRLYYEYANAKDGYAMYLREFDIRVSPPRLLHDIRFARSDEVPAVNDFSPNSVALDTKRRRLYIVSVSGSVVGCADDPLCGSSTPAPVKLFVFDLKSFSRLATINVQLTVPAFAARGITYSEADDRIYMGGEMQPGGLLKLQDLTGAFPRSFPAAIAAIDADTQKMAWVKVFPECEVPIATLNYGVQVRRSRLQPAIYFACARSFIYPGLSGLIRVWIDPKATLVEAQNFRTEFFPISGSYANEVGILGVAAFDYATDRFYMQSQAVGTPGAWVFDGRVSAWVGFIVSPDNFNGYSGLNQTTGRYYMGGGNPDAVNRAYVVVSDGRSTPVPQGQVNYSLYNLSDQIHTDGPTGRLFLKVRGTKDTDPDGNWLIFKDRSPPIELDKPTDYDTLTVDTAESAKTISTFAGDVQGWGARAVLVGGTSGLTSFCTGINSFDCSDVFTTPANSIPENMLLPSLVLFDGTRSIFASRVGSVDVRNVGAAASAQALTLDPISDAEYRDKVQKTAHDRTEALAGEEAAAQVAMMLKWPQAPAACLDADGKGASDKTDGQGGGAQTDCDLEKYKAEASTSFGALSLGNDKSPAFLSVGSSSFATHVLRDAKLGIVTETTAISDQVRIGGSGVGSISIGRVVAKAITTARGRPGTAKATWTRTLEHVVVKDAAGKAIFECSIASQCQVGDAVTAMNEVLKTRIRITAPTASLVETHGGAFSSVLENEKDYLNGRIANEDENKAVPALEITVFNDGVQRSRLLLQLAAIQSSSIYGISLLSEVGEFPPGPIIPIPSIGPLPDLPIIGGDGGNGTGYQPGNPVTRIGQTAVFLIRSPKQAFLFGLTTLLFAAAIGAVWRRVVLIRGLGEGT